MIVLLLKRQTLRPQELGLTPAGRTHVAARQTATDNELFALSSLEAAERGELITANDMIAALADQTGRRVDQTTMYRMLERHGWRKVMPRPTHRDGDPERQAAFEETSRS